MRSWICYGLFASLTLVPLIGSVARDATARDDPPQPRPEVERFDKLVREDLFAGFGGDEAALARGLGQCEATLARDPKHAEALVWRGRGSRLPGEPVVRQEGDDCRDVALVEGNHGQWTMPWRSRPIIPASGFLGPPCSSRPPGTRPPR